MSDTQENEQEKSPADELQWWHLTLSSIGSFILGAAGGFFAGRASGSSTRPSDVVNPDSERPDPKELENEIRKELQQLRDRPTSERIDRLLERAKSRLSGGAGSDGGGGSSGD